MERYFTPTPEELEFAHKGTRSDGARLTLLTQLKLFQMLHRLPTKPRRRSFVTFAFILVSGRK
jgi:hypothetical protein